MTLNNEKSNKRTLMNTGCLSKAVHVYNGSKLGSSERVRERNGRNALISWMQPCPVQCWIGRPKHGPMITIL